MFTIRKATLEDIPLINKLAWEAFPATYKNILTPEQIDYMMDWMYSPENLHKQMTEEGHIYYIAFEECEGAGYVSIQPEGKDLFHLQKIYVRNTTWGSSSSNKLSEVSKNSIPNRAAWN